MLKREGIQFQVCRNPDVKCSIIARPTARTATNYKYFYKKRTDTLTYSLNLSGPTTTGFTLQLAWRHQK